MSKGKNKRNKRSKERDQEAYRKFREQFVEQEAKIVNPKK